MQRLPFRVFESVETIPDECKEVEGEMSCPSKCATPKGEEIVHPGTMIKCRIR